MRFILEPENAFDEDLSNLGRRSSGMRFVSVVALVQSVGRIVIRL
jgi:hypothetical protein